MSEISVDCNVTVPEEKVHQHGQQRNPQCPTVPTALLSRPAVLWLWSTASLKADTLQ